MEVGRAGKRGKGWWGVRKGFYQLSVLCIHQLPPAPQREAKCFVFDKNRVRLSPHRDKKSQIGARIPTLIISNRVCSMVLQRSGRNVVVAPSRGVR